MKRFFKVLAMCILAVSAFACDRPQTPFVTVKDGHFVRDGKP